MRVGFIGTGEIAAAMVQGLAGRGHDLIVSQRNTEMAGALAKRFQDVRVAGNDAIVAEAEVVFLCLMADVAREVLPGLAFRAGQSVISVMVDVPLADLRRFCAPAEDIALTIPLSAVATGGSVLPVHPDNAALRQLFGESDQVIPVATETGLNAHFAASALSAPLLAQMKTGAEWLAGQTGDAAAAEAYVAGVFAGFLRQMAAGDADFTALLRALDTPGGLNATLKAGMERAGAPQALSNGLDGLKPRLGL